MTQTMQKTNAKVRAWCLYDWANSAFSTVIMTFVFSVYFTKGIVGSDIEGSALWGYGMGCAGLAVAVMGPVFGVFLDLKGRHRLMLRIITVLTVAAIAGLFFMKPSPEYTAPALWLVALAVIGFELGQIVYNAMLPGIAPPERMGRVSGWAWGLGYAGGLACLVAALVLFIGVPGVMEAVIPLGQDEQIHVRATCLLTAAWFFVFSVPLLCHSPDEPGIPGRSDFSASVIMGAVMAAFLKLKDLRNIVRFLIASALYRDGLATLFAVGGVYAAGSFDMDFSQILMFGIGLNVTAGLGAFAFSFMDDRAGSRLTVIVGLWALILLGAGIVVAQERWVFIALALALGIFVGPVQAASRTLMARIAPAENMSEMFGLYALTGKSISFLGPLCFAFATDMFESQRAGVATIVLFWAVGLWLLHGVRERQEQA